MGTLNYVGADVSDVDDVSYKDYVDIVKSADPSDAHIDSVIATQLFPYATKSYVDSHDSLLATRAYIDAQDNLRLKLADKGVVNGIVGLDAAARVNQNLIDAPLTQSFLRGPWSPAAYQGANIDGIGTTEATVHTCGVTDPGYAYKLVVFGSYEVTTDTAGDLPTVLVRQGSNTGPIVAQGHGSTEEFYGYGIDEFERTNATDLGADWSITYVFSDPNTGVLATPDGHNASWTATHGTDGPNYARVRRINATDGVPSGDYLHIQFTVNTVNSARLGGVIDMIGRWLPGTSDTDKYVAFRFINGEVQCLYGNPGDSSASQLGSNVTCALTAGSTYDCFWGVFGTSTVRRFQVFKNGIMNLNVLDSSNATPLGSTNRRWGFGVGADTNVAPATLSNIRMFDPATSTPTPLSQAVIVPVNIGSLSPLTGATTLYVQLVGSAATGKVTATTFMPDLYVQAVPV